MNATVLASSVTSARELARIRREENERAQQAAHAAALDVMEVIGRLSGPLPPTGPRTGTHPAAIQPEKKTPMDQKIDSILIRPRPAEQPRDYVPPAPQLHTMARTANAYLPLLLAIGSFIGGIALGKIL